MVFQQRSEIPAAVILMAHVVNWLRRSSSRICNLLCGKHKFLRIFSGYVPLFAPASPMNNKHVVVFYDFYV